MGYYVRAIIGKDLSAGGSRFRYAKVLSLRRGLGMIPGTDDLFDEIQAALPDGGEPFRQFEKLSVSVARWVRDLSAGGLVAYI